MLKIYNFTAQPVIVEAIQWSGKQEDWDDLEKFVGGTVVHDAGFNGINILTETNRDMQIMPGEWIVKYSNGIYDKFLDYFMQFLFVDGE